VRRPCIIFLSIFVWQNPRLCSGTYHLKTFCFCNIKLQGCCLPRLTLLPTWPALTTLGIENSSQKVLVKILEIRPCPQTHHKQLLAGFRTSMVYPQHTRLLIGDPEWWHVIWPCFSFLSPLDITSTFPLPYKSHIFSVYHIYSGATIWPSTCLNPASGSSLGVKHAFFPGTALPPYPGASSPSGETLPYNCCSDFTSSHHFCTLQVELSIGSHLSLQLSSYLFFSPIKCDHRTNLIYFFFVNLGFKKFAVAGIDY
jgi:hypothetical protein